MFQATDLSYYIISLGCSKNLTESEKINGLLDAAGMQLAEDPEVADIIIINTCGFIEDAKKEAIDTIFDVINIINNNERKNFNNFDQRIVAVGCFTKRYFNDIEAEIPEIDFMYGIIDEAFIPNLFKKFNIKSSLELFDKRKPLVPGLPYEYIKISDGCSNNCSYCAIPLIRGPIVSFSKDKILEDVKLAASRNVVELNIIGQDIASYNDNGFKLHNLISEISKVNGPEWIRLLYCHPDHISDDIINEIKNNKKVVKYIDVPFQHISEKILKSMNRKGNYEKYLNLVKKLRNEIPGIVIRSTFMVGYPGEEEIDFEMLLDFINEAKLDRVGCFMYSKEEGTAAFDLPDVDENIKVDRYNLLMETQRNISLNKLNDFVGKRLKVLVEQKVDDNNYIGRTEYDAPEVDGIFYLTASNLDINKIVEAKVDQSIDYDLIGSI